MYQLGKVADADFWLNLNEKGSFTFKTLNDDMAPLKMVVTNQTPLSFPLLQPSVYVATKSSSAEIPFIIFHTCHFSS